MHSDTIHMAVVMPDARAGRANPRHDDNSLGKAHAGYARFNLANLKSGIPLGSNDDGPAFEVVHRFDGETFDLGLPDEAKPGSISGTPKMPDFERFAPVLDVLPAVLDKAPADPVLMRMLLRGGTITAMGKQKDWHFSDVLNPGAPEYSGQFASVVQWSRPVDANELTVTMRRFDGSPGTQLRLTPTNDEKGKPAITIKVANLCAENPLEWPELELHFVDGDDVDFKWLYRLYHPTSGTLASLLDGEPLPVPIQSQLQTFGTQGCMGAVRKFDFEPATFTA
jgi:hypothetical protein